MKKLLLRYLYSLLFIIGFLAFGEESWAQTYTVNNVTAGLASGSLTGYQTNAVFGFSVQPSSATTIQTFNISRNSGTDIRTLFANAKLYTSSTGDYSTAVLTDAGGVVNITSTLITFSSLSQIFTAGQTKYYWLVIDDIYNGAPGPQYQGCFVFGQSPSAIISSTNSSSSFSAYGNTYNFQASVAPTMSNLTGGLNSAATLTGAQSAVVLFGFSLTGTGNIKYSQFNINSGNASLSTYFTGFKLFRNTTNDYITGTKTQVGTATASGSYVNVTSFTETFNNNSGQTNYYFLVADYTGTGTIPSSVQFNFANAQSSTALTQSYPAANTYNNFTVTGTQYSFNTANIAMSALTAGLTSTTVYPGQLNAAVFGFSLSSSSGTSTISGMNINSDNASLSTYYSNFRLYSNTTNDYSTGTKTLLATTASASAAFINFPTLNANQTINGTAKYYFLVADVSYSGAGTNSTTFRFVSGQGTNALVQSSPTSAYNTFNVSGNAYNITQPTIAVSTAGISGVLSASNLYYGNTDIPVYGFSVAVTGNTTFSGVRFNDIQGVNTATAFSSCKLYKGTSSTFDPTLTSYTLLATGTRSGSQITFSSFSDPINNTTQYYYLLVDDVYYVSSGYFQPTINQYTTSSGVVNPSPIYGPATSNWSLPVLAVASYNNTSNGITPGSLSYGQTDIVLFGCSIQVTGGLTITGINFSAAGFPSSVPNAYFSNARVYRSTTNVFPGGTPLYTSASVTPGTSVFAATVNETIKNTTYYYWLVADYTVITGGALSSFAAGFNAGGNVQSPAAVVVASPASTYNTFYYTGNYFTVVNTVDWTGAVNNDLTNAGNYLTLSGGAVGTAPTGGGSNQNITIGKRAVTGGRYPIITAATELGKITFDPTVTASPTLTISGGSLQLNGGLIIKDGSSPTITGGTVTLPAATASFMYPTSRLTLGANTIINNSGTFTLLSSSAGTASIANIPSTSSMQGNYVVQRYFTGGTLANRGYRLLSSPVNNSGTRPVTGAATYNFTSLKTNLLITGAGGSVNGWDQPSGYTANGPTILFYNTATNNFSIPTTLASTSGTAGKGFYFYFRGDNQNNLTNKVVKATNYAVPEANIVGLQSGTLNQQGFTYTLANGYTLVGNPYPSSITITAAAITGLGTPFVYTYTSGGSSITQQAVPWQVASGQGFFIRATGAGLLTFSEGLKTTGQPTLLMGAPTTFTEGNIQLQMVQDSANYDYAQLRFMDSYNKNYNEQEDADDFNGSGQVVFFGAMTADNKLVGIASQPLEKQTTSVYLSVNDNTSGTFKINKIDLSGIPDKYDVRLIDHFKLDSIDLRTTNSYTFNMDKTNAATFGNTRMEVVIRKKVLPPYKLLTFTGIRIATKNVLAWTTQNEYVYTYFELERSFDGKTYEGTNNSISTGAGKYTFTDQSNKPLVYYRLKQTDINDVVTYSTIVILKSENSSNTFTVFPNPTADKLNFAITQEVKGTVTLRICNSVGTLMKTQTYTANSGDQDVTSLPPGSYYAELIDNNSKKLIASAKFIKL